MFVSHIDDIPGKAIEAEGVRNVTKQILIGAHEGWSDHVMRRFSLEEGGHTPRHTHGWPHIIYVLQGTGTLFLDGKDHPIRAGSTAFVPGGREHQLSQSGEGPMAFLCIVPKEGEA